LYNNSFNLLLGSFGEIKKNLYIFLSTNKNHSLQKLKQPFVKIMLIGKKNDNLGFKSNNKKHHNLSFLFINVAFNQPHFGHFTFV